MHENVERWQNIGHFSDTCVADFRIGFQNNNFQELLVQIYIEHSQFIILVFCFR